MKKLKVFYVLELLNALNRQFFERLSRKLKKRAKNKKIRTPPKNSLLKTLTLKDYIVKEKVI